MSFDRNGTLLSHEGHILQIASAHGRSNATEFAQAAIDGNINALVRLNGARDTALFVYALCDRLGDTALGHTPWPHQIIGPVAVSPPIPLPAPAPAPAPRRYGFWTIFSIGFALGVVWGVALIAPFIAAAR